MIKALKEKMEAHAVKLAAWDMWYSNWGGFLMFLWTWFKGMFFAMKHKEAGGEWRAPSDDPTMDA